MAEWMDFLGRLARNPRSVGAIAPSSPRLGRLMARQVGDPASARVLEVGAGTGAITQQILRHGIAPERLTIIEADAGFAAMLEARFPNAEVLHGDAFAPENLRRDPPFDAIISGIPLLNFPKEVGTAFVEAAVKSVSPGGRFVQFSYGLTPPVAATPAMRVTLAGRVWRNLPPARVWVYRAN